ncbi:hypothetical protein ACFOQM_02710 [Paenibacillus sp. GCM10012307]|uniref:Uncharacterized protein n=1 Tax=Paenibacillus roseus TaxID=2798579 RepID=A0A934IVT9_9BACL|nr:hypothetical protein [Paenibacillus roseus]MBJ6360227.1 hypothetical protein [Paenibacillus roseus]
MSEPGNSSQTPEAAADISHEGREDYFMDIDRMVNEGLGGGQVTPHNGLIDDSTTDTMDEENRSFTEE